MLEHKAINFENIESHIWHVCVVSAPHSSHIGSELAALASPLSAFIHVVFNSIDQEMHVDKNKGQAQ